MSETSRDVLTKVNIMKRAITKVIDQINEMLPKVNALDEYVSTYDGGTFPYYIILDKPIEVKNQFVYIHEDNGEYRYGFEKRYNTNNDWQLEELMYHLRLIKKEFKKAISYAGN